MNFPIDVNLVTFDELTAIDGVGEKTAKDILSLRDSLGVISDMDQLLENLPEDKIAEFAKSDQFETYKKLFKELGLA